MIVAFGVSYCAGQSNNEIFMKMVGPAVVFDTVYSVKFLQGQPKQKFSVDSNHDGRIDVIYFIDNDKKHGGKRSPLLVKIVDEDGDMYLTSEGDQDSDLYIADWYGDGSIDRVVDYRDVDGDDDMDEQYLYQWIEEDYTYFSPKTYQGRSYCLTYAQDIGDDNRLWHHENYEYSQWRTEWLSDFNGDEMFVYPFYFDYAAGTLTPACEISFCFYDADGDSISEEAVRFEGARRLAESLRYSMDIDNDADAITHHDYDFSITSLGPVELPEADCMRLNIRGIMTEPIFDWSKMRRFSKNHEWGRTLLTWDENDNNVDPRPGSLHNERWEGVLNHDSEFMPQVGGPSCGPFNKRNEVDRDFSGRFKFYISPVDRRMHLLGSEIGWIKADYDYDGRIDMVIWTEDTDGNGFFDTWKYDNDADGNYDLVYRITADSSETLTFDYQTLHKAWMPLLEEATAQNTRIISTLKNVLGRSGGLKVANPVEDYFDSRLISYGKDFRLGEKIKNSPAGRRYYQDLIRIYYWNAVRGTESIARKAGFSELEKAYAEGRFNEAAKMLEVMVPANGAGKK